MNTNQSSTLQNSNLENSLTVENSEQNHVFFEESINSSKRIQEDQSCSSYSCSYSYSYDINTSESESLQDNNNNKDDSINIIVSDTPYEPYDSDDDHINILLYETQPSGSQAVSKYWPFWSGSYPSSFNDMTAYEIDPNVLYNKPWNTQDCEMNEYFNYELNPSLWIDYSKQQLEHKEDLCPIIPWDITEEQKTQALSYVPNNTPSTDAEIQQYLLERNELKPMSLPPFMPGMNINFQNPDNQVLLQLYMNTLNTMNPSHLQPNINISNLSQNTMSILPPTNPIMNQTNANPIINQTNVNPNFIIPDQSVQSFIQPSLSLSNESYTQDLRSFNPLSTSSSTINPLTLNTLLPVPVTSPILRTPQQDVLSLDDILRGPSTTNSQTKKDVYNDRSSHHRSHSRHYNRDYNKEKERSQYHEHRTTNNHMSSTKDSNSSSHYKENKRIYNTSDHKEQYNNKYKEKFDEKNKEKNRNDNNENTRNKDHEKNRNDSNENTRNKERKQTQEKDKSQSQSQTKTNTSNSHSHLNSQIHTKDISSHSHDYNQNHHTSNKDSHTSQHHESSHAPSRSKEHHESSHAPSRSKEHHESSHAPSRSKEHHESSHTSSREIDRTRTLKHTPSSTSSHVHDKYSVKEKEKHISNSSRRSSSKHH